uniref:WD repeat-containing protein 55 homolog n=1 Tax=Clastoptera arizonana TaxID=38151 RepID=A0A1B6CKQ1_9HEMI
MDRTKFSLLLLEPGEIFFEDLSVVLCSSNELKPKLKLLADSTHMGRLKICSKSLVYEPKDFVKPIIKIPLKDCTTIEQLQVDDRERLTSNTNANIISIDCNQYVEMLEGNILAPYVFKNARKKFIFCLNYGHIEDCLRRIGQLHRASTLTAAEQNQMINTIENFRQLKATFDPLWLQDLYEKVILETTANKITPLVVNPGIVLLSTTTLYFQSFNRIEPNQILRINLSEIKSITKRRFLLQHVSVELQFSKNNSVTHLYLVFQTTQIRDTFVQCLLNQPVLKLDESDQERMTLQWQNGVLSNYEYILYLNSLADRTFNDLTQYPVFPWVVQDYHSNYLDLNDPAVYRDLSKPIGALNPDRLEKLKDRYSEMPPPKFLYGSHYSTPGFVLFYLVRKYPHYMLCLQNGRFDHPDRMFNSMQDVWRNVLTNMSDFKELVPEFYDTDGEGDFLCNKFGINFGYRHDGIKVNDVALPPWASDSKSFVSQMREALESDYVSSNLHNWIDLIFGYKQTGVAAEKNDNVFFYLCYEGAVDLETISDWNKRYALEVQIMEFGQIPKQIFQAPHPQKNSTPINVPKSLPYISRPGKITLEGLRISHTVTSHKDSIHAVTLDSEMTRAISAGKDGVLKIHSIVTGKQERSIALSAISLSSVLLLPSTVVAGSWDSTIIAYDIECGRVIDNCMGHEDAVSCILWGHKKNILVSGSWDCFVRVWQSRPVPPYEPIRPATALIKQLEHEAKVIAIDIDSENVRLVSGTEEGEVLMWSLETFSLSLSFSGHLSCVNAVKFSPDGTKLVTCSDDKSFKVFDTTTGMQLFNKTLNEELKCLAWDGYCLILGGFAGNLYIWDLINVALIETIAAHDGAVLCLALSENRSVILSGGEDHKLKIWKAT